MSPNYLTAIKAYLASVTAVTNLISPLDIHGLPDPTKARIWFPEIPEDQEKGMPQPAILLQQAGGTYPSNYILYQKL